MFNNSIPNNASDNGNYSKNNYQKVKSGHSRENFFHFNNDCDEKLFFEPGTTGFAVFKYEDTTFGMLICFDWIYPEAMRTLAVKGAQVILHGANLVMSYCPAAMITRALENHVFIVTANRTGTERRNGIEHTFIGKSQIVSPKGKVLIKANRETCVKIEDINPQEALDKKITERNDLLKDRRTDLYFK